MSIKMATLMNSTGETRSTLLFYVKEGLLKEPQKPKPNVHLYEDDSIQRVRLIKTLQNQLHYSITQIKQVFNDNQFDFNSGVEDLVQKLDLFTGVKERRYKSLGDALEVYDLDKKTILSYVDDGILEMHDGFFSDSSWKSIQILNDIKEYSKAPKLLKHYLKHAKELASLEFELAKELIEKDKTNHAQELFLDLILNLKPYIFNLQTKQEHTRRTND
jgi:DNA-binding transcriptional MerR regulator